MSLSFVVQQTLRLMNPPPPTGTAALTADEAMVATTPPGLPASSAADAGGASDESAATATTATAAEVEGQVWSRLRDFEAEEAQSINQRLVTRHQRAHHHDTYTPEGELLFTERYIQRYLEEEERTKRESADWTRNLDSSTARFRAGGSGVGGIGGEFKESDAATQRHYDTTHVGGGDEEEGGDYNHYYDNAASDDRLAGGSASHHSVRSSLSSVGRALGRKVKHSSSKIASSLGNAGRRAHHRGRDKGKEAAAASSAWPDYSAVAADYGYVSPSFDLAGVGGLGVVPGTAMAGEEERSFPLFSAGVAGVGPSSSSSSSTAGGFEKLWERDYSPFSTYAFDQRAPQPANASSFAYDDGDDDDDGDDELPPLESLDP